MGCDSQFDDYGPSYTEEELAGIAAIYAEAQANAQYFRGNTCLVCGAHIKWENNSRYSAWNRYDFTVSRAHIDWHKNSTDIPDGTGKHRAV